MAEIYPLNLSGNSERERNESNKYNKSIVSNFINFST